MNDSRLLPEPPIEQVYRTETPNSTIDFEPVDVIVSSEDGTEVTSGLANVEARLLPTPSMRFVIPEAKTLSMQQMWDYMDRVAPMPRKVSFPEFGTSVEMHLLRPGSEYSFYEPTRLPMQMRPESNAIVKATFHLFNWPHFYGLTDYGLSDGTCQDKYGNRYGRVVMRFDGWEVTVIANRHTRRLIESLKDSGGYALTHVGSIVRFDSSPFSTSDLDDLIEGLTFFFSFLLGRWSGPQLTVGVDQDGHRVFESWGLGRVDSGHWKGSRSCFDSHHAEMLTDVVAGFWRRWTNDKWRRALSESIYWYLNANSDWSGIGVDSALLFTQSALELLAWNYCVIDQQMISSNAFKPSGLTAADKLRLLVSTMGIPKEIPQFLSSLPKQTPRQGKKWEDALEAITELRNGLVHPGRDRAVKEGAYFDAFRLSLWYIEMVLLRVFGYAGKYGNRLAYRVGGDVEMVPWNER